MCVRVRCRLVTFVADALALVGLMQTIEGQAQQIKGMQDSIHGMNTRMDSFIDQQMQLSNRNQTIQAENATQMAKVFEMLTAMQRNDKRESATASTDSQSEHPDKKTKIDTTS